MDRNLLLDQIDFAQARIEEIERQVINVDPTTKGFKELVDSYNKWIDRYNDLMTQEQHFDDDTIEKRKLDLEEDKVRVELDRLALEKEKVAAMREIEADKLEFEKEKFDREVQTSKWEKPVDIALKLGELGIKIAVPLIGIAGTMAVARLAYVNDAELNLCNGRIFAQAKDLIKLTTTKV